MNFALDDRHRSLRRFLMAALGSPPWRVRTERQPVTDEERPVAVVEVTSPELPGRPARVSIPQGNVERRQTFTLTLYPALGETAAEARLEAARVAQLLSDAIGVGLVLGDGSNLTRPERLPVYDFSGVPVKGALRAGPADAYGWLWVEDFPVRPVQDPDDPLRWTVACDLRVSWEQAGRAVAPAPLVGAFGGSWMDIERAPAELLPRDVTVGQGPPTGDVQTRFYFDELAGILYERSS